MADYTQTITNSLNVLAASPPTLWGSFNWGEQNWGQDEDLWTDTVKGITETLYLSDAYGRAFVKAPLTETITFTENLESLKRSIGVWDYVFTKPSSDGDEAIYDVSSKVGDASTTWSAVSNVSTTWS